MRPASSPCPKTGVQKGESAMTDLIGRLNAALDEDERIATQATTGDWRWTAVAGKAKLALVGDQTVLPVANSDVYPSKYDAAHIVRHDPEAILRKLAGARKLIELHKPRTVREGVYQCGHCADLCHSGSGLGCDSPDAPYPCETIEALAEMFGVEVTS